MKPNAARPGGHPRTAEFTGPLSIPGGEVAGAEIVRELGAEVSLAVWQTLRGVLMWAAETPEARPALFDAEAMRAWECELLVASWEPELRYPLAVLVGELAGDPTPEPIARACLCVTDWALTREAWSTALAFAEAAALAWPEHPRYAWTVGRLLRKRGRLREAEQWIRRCIRVSVAAGDWEAQALGLNSLGNLFHKQGNYPESLRMLRDALRVARKHRLRERQGEILHDLCVLNMWAGELDRAEPLAMEAFCIYQPGHHRLPALAHDVATLWLMRGHPRRAFSLLKELLDFFDEPEDRVRVAGALARAAGEIGQREAFGRAWLELWELAAIPFVTQTAAAAMLEAALGASALAEWDLSEGALRQAMDVAAEVGEADVLVKAERALEAVRARVTPQSLRPAEPHRSAKSDTVAADLLASLHAAGTPAMS